MSQQREWATERVDASVSQRWLSEEQLNEFISVWWSNEQFTKWLRLRTVVRQWLTCHSTGQTGAERMAPTLTAKSTNLGLWKPLIQGSPAWLQNSNLTIARHSTERAKAYVHRRLSLVPTRTIPTAAPLEIFLLTHSTIARLLHVSVMWASPGLFRSKDPKEHKWQNALIFAQITPVSQTCSNWIWISWKCFSFLTMPSASTNRCRQVGRSKTPAENRALVLPLNKATGKNCN